MIVKSLHGVSRMDLENYFIDVLRKFLEQIKKVTSRNKTKTASNDLFLPHEVGSEF